MVTPKGNCQKEKKTPNRIRSKPMVTSLQNYTTLKITHLDEWFLYNSTQFTFPESVNPANMKLMSSPLLHLSVLPSMFSSTLVGSEKQTQLHVQVYYWSKVKHFRNFMK